MTVRGPDDISYDRLNAFVDGELDAQDEGRVLDALRRDPELAQQVHELRLNKDLMRHAYPPAPGVRRVRRKSLPGGWRGLAAAAVALIAIGAAGGWAGHTWQNEDADDYSRLARSATSATAAPTDDKILLHVSSSAPDRVAAMLEETESALAAARRDGRALQVEILANNTGLDVLRADRPGPAAQLEALRARYPNLTLVACRQTIERLHEKGVTVRLLPDAEVATSALDEVVKRIHEGWTYVRT
jgi:intracellular sulfur oxidation DsrE/DsrF family protein